MGQWKRTVLYVTNRWYQCLKRFVCHFRRSHRAVSSRSFTAREISPFLFTLVLPLLLLSILLADASNRWTEAHLRQKFGNVAQLPVYFSWFQLLGLSQEGGKNALLFTRWSSSAIGTSSLSRSWHWFSRGVFPFIWIATTLRGSFSFRTDCCLEKKSTHFDCHF